jgi:transposase
MDRHLLEHYLRRGLSLPQIGALVKRDPSTVGYWVQKFGMIANGRDEHAPKGGLARGELEPLVLRGLPLAEIADELGVSTRTVRYWTGQYGLPRPIDIRRNGAMAAAKAGQRTCELECKTHGLTDFILEARGYYRCKRCRSERVVQWRRRAKQRLVREAGGRCAVCGYDRCTAALEFHHLSPNEKSFGLSMRGITRSIEKLREEAAKCVLLCANCHAEVEAGAASLPDDIARPN